MRFGEIGSAGLEIFLHLAEHRDQPVGAVADTGKYRDGGSIGLPLEAAGIPVVDHGGGNIADRALECLGQIGKFLAAEGLGALRGQGRQRLRQPALVDRLKPVPKLDVPDFVGQHGGDRILAFTTAQHAAGDENQASGRREGVDLSRIQDQETVAAERLRPVGGLRQGLSQEVQVVVGLGVRVRLVLVDDDRPDGPSDVIFLLRGDILEGLCHSRSGFGNRFRLIPRHEPLRLSHRCAYFRRFFESCAALPTGQAYEEERESCRAAQPSHLPPPWTGARSPSRRKALIFSCGTFMVCILSIQEKSISWCFLLNSASTSALNPLPARASSPLEAAISASFLLALRTILFSLKAEECIHPGGPFPGGTIRIHPSLSSRRSGFHHFGQGPGQTKSRKTFLPDDEVFCETIQALRLRAHPGDSSEEGKNMGKKIVIIGGVSIGPKAAARARRRDPDADITILEKGEYLSYAGCATPYFIAGMIVDYEELMMTPAGIVMDTAFFKNIKAVHVHNKTMAEDIDPLGKIVRGVNVDTGERLEFPYDQLVIATGSMPVRPSLPGIDLQGVHVLSNLEEAIEIRKEVEDGRRRVVIVGAGLIGMEMAEAFAARGAEITMVELKDQVLPALLDREMAFLVEKHLAAKKVTVKTGVAVQGLSGDDQGRVTRVVTTHGDLPADLVLVAVGVRPNVTLAAAGGLAIGHRGGVGVGED